MSPECWPHTSIRRTARFGSDHGPNLIMALRIRPAIAGLPPYKPGRPAPAGPDGTSYKLSSNENPYPPLPGILDAVTAACGRMNRYPDLGNTAATAALAEKFGVAAEQVAMGTGSVAVLYHLLQTVAGDDDEVIYAWRSFEAYPIAVQVTGARSVRVPLGPSAEHDLNAMRDAITERTRAVLICTPNNPTGPVVDHDALVNFVDQVPDDVLVIIDEAYVEFADQPNAARGLELIQGRPNVVVLRTLSKAYGLAGFRVGFCIGDPELISAVRAVSLPFGVSLPAQAAVLAALDYEPALLERVRELVRERERVVGGLRELGLSIPAAQGNFYWLPGGSATLDHAEAFVRAGLMVRPFADGGAWDGLRISVGEPEANALVLRVAARLGEV